MIYATGMSKNSRITDALRVIRLEAEGLNHLADALGSHGAQAFSEAVETVLGATGYLVVIGVGKSGHIAQKLAASFASTGTPAFFMHPTEASHGDLGMVKSDSVVLALSNGGESRELIDVLHYCTKASIPVIGMTRAPDSTLGRASKIVLQLPDTAEACPNGLAPTTSTTNMLALGDALIVATMTERGVTRTDFGRRHPGGKLGRGLHTVGDWMALHPSPPPLISDTAHVPDVVSAMSEGQSGCVAVVDATGQFVGMITDGDLRRAMTPDMFSRNARDIMTANATTLNADQRMSEVIEILQARRIANAFVVQDGVPVAVVDMKDLMTQGYV